MFILAHDGVAFLLLAATAARANSPKVRPQFLKHFNLLRIFAHFKQRRLVLIPIVLGASTFLLNSLAVALVVYRLQDSW